MDKFTEAMRRLIWGKETIGYFVTHNYNGGNREEVIIEYGTYSSKRRKIYHGRVFRLRHTAGEDLAEIIEAGLGLNKEGPIDFIGFFHDPYRAEVPFEDVKSYLSQPYESLPQKVDGTSLEETLRMHPLRRYPLYVVFDDGTVIDSIHAPVQALIRSAEQPLYQLLRNRNFKI